MKEVKITPQGIKQAIDDLLNENEMLQDKIYKLEERIDKAIEYIREYRNGWNNWFEFTIEDKLNLLNILKGSDKE